MHPICFQNDKENLNHCLFVPNIGMLYSPYYEYEPTIGCRILEFNFADTCIELWDSSGNIEYRSCWPAIKENSQATIMVYDAHISNENKNGNDQEEELVLWRDEFCDQMSEEKVLILAHSKNKDPTESFENDTTPQCFRDGIVHHTSFSHGKDLLFQLETFLQQSLHRTK